MKKVEIDEKEKKEILDEFYKSFDTGYDFEEFLKPLLEELGLDEVHVTKRSQDGGVDLEGMRYGVLDNNDDAVLYRVQAKRYKPDSTIGVDIVDRHLGIMNNGEKGIIITTGKFSSASIEAATRKSETPIVLIDGLSLIDLCIEKNIGFVFKPFFSKNELINYYKKSESAKTVEKESEKEYIVSNIEKEITSNDIRARILSIPRAIIEVLPIEKEIFNIKFNGVLIADVRISADRRYFSKGMSNMYRKNGLLTEDNVFNATKSLWNYDGETIVVNLIGQGE